MNRVAVFGKPGSGKSTFSKNLAAHSGLPLYALDSIYYQPDGTAVSADDFNHAHHQILSSEQWIIDGFGPKTSFDQRLAAADTLIYIDLPYWQSYWLVTKRCLKGFWVLPEGWPEGSSIIKGTVESFRVLKRCPAFWNEQFLEQLQQQSTGKNLHVIRSLRELKQFFN